MNKQEAILKIKETLKSLMKFESEVVENTFAEVLTQDGLKLSYDGEFTTDAPIFVVDEQGNRTPCEDNEYVLQNGQTIVVKSGKISEIKEETVVENGGETPVEDANVETDIRNAPMAITRSEIRIIQTSIKIDGTNILFNMGKTKSIVKSLPRANMSK